MDADRMTAVILGGLLRFCRHEVRKEWGPDSCIATTAIAIDVADYFGLKARPLAVKVRIYNPPMAKRIESGVQEYAVRDVIAWEKEDGSWSLGLGFGDGTNDPAKWPGHLVAVIENDADVFMADLSLDQAARLHRQMPLQPAILRVKNPQFLAGLESSVYRANGCVLCYESYPNDDSYKTAPDWRIKSRHQKCVGRVIRRIKEFVRCIALEETA